MGILCFMSEEHTLMFVVGLVVFVLVPAPFFAAACYCTWLFPRRTARVSESSALFLNATRFFFAKFDPTKYYYGLCMLIRSLLICLVPVIIRDNLPLQVILIALVIGAIHLVQTQTMPWRVPLNNFIDTGINVSMWMLMMVGSMCVGMSADLDSIRVVGTVIFILAFILAVGSLIASGSKMFRGGPFYGYFICHDRAHAAAQARLLKALLRAKVGQAVYVDTDDLTELDGLLDMLKSRVGTLIAFLTRSTLSKPACAAEITIALMTSKCKVLAVQTQSFVPPDEDDLDDLGSYLDLQSCNVEHYGITTAHMTAAFRKLLSVAVTPCVDMPEHLSGTRRFEVLAGMIDAPVKSDVGISHELPKLDSETMSGKLVISSDSHCDEATAVVFLLKIKMKAGLESIVPAGVCCLCDYDCSRGSTLESVSSSRALVVVLSPGTLASPEQLALAAWATKKRQDAGMPDVIPVNIPGFVYPTEEFFQQTSPKIFRTSAGVKFGFTESHDYVESLREFFRSTRTALSTHASERVLDHEVQELLSRMRRGPRRSTTSRSTFSRASKDSRTSGSVKNLSCTDIDTSRVLVSV